MWNRIGNIEKDPIPSTIKFPNKKSLYVLQVQDKVFKMRKNPAYTGPLNLPELPADPVEETANQPEGIVEEDDDVGGAQNNNEDL